MRALLLDRELSLHGDFPIPNRAAGESLIDVSLAGICGTDLELIRGYMNFRGIPGHEFVGRVRESDNALLTGKRVVGEINAACGNCEFCRTGMRRHCERRTVLGILGLNGAWAEQLALSSDNLFVVPDSVPDEIAVFVEPIAAAYEIFEQVLIPRNARILILGDGGLGALVALAFRAEGYAPLLAGHHRKKLARIANLGIEVIGDATLDHKFDVVVDCTGRSSGFERALELVKPRGTIVLKSTVASGTTLNLAAVAVNEVTIMGSRCGRFKPALDALADGRIDPRSLVDQVFNLEEGLSAVRAAGDPANFKILLKPTR